MFGQGRRGRKRILNGFLQIIFLHHHHLVEEGVKGDLDFSSCQRVNMHFSWRCTGWPQGSHFPTYYTWARPYFPSFLPLILEMNWIFSLLLFCWRQTGKMIYLLHTEILRGKKAKFFFSDNFAGRNKKKTRKEEVQDDFFLCFFESEGLFGC